MKEKNKFFVHLNRWKSLYEIIGVVIAVFISACSVFLANKTLKVQNLEFKLRNRPCIIFGDISFAGKYKDHSPNVYDSTVVEKNKFGVLTDGKKEGHTYPISILIDISNINDTPARNVLVNRIVYVNGKEVSNQNCPFESLVKNNKIFIGYGLTEELYNQIRDNSVNLIIVCLATYSSLLNDDLEKYKTTLKVMYNNEVPCFEVLEQNIY